MSETMSFEWDDKTLSTAGEITDAALRVARDKPALAPLFLAAYSVDLVRKAPELGAKAPAVAIENLGYMASHYDTESYRLIAKVYGNYYNALTVTGTGE